MYMSMDGFELQDGEFHCVNEACDWWVPEGMEYLAEGHDCAEWAALKDTPEERIRDIKETIRAARRYMSVEPTPSDIQAMCECDATVSEIEVLLNRI